MVHGAGFARPPRASDRLARFPILRFRCSARKQAHEIFGKTFLGMTLYWIFCRKRRTCITIDCSPCLQRIGWASDTTRRNAEDFAYAVGQ